MKKTMLTFKRVLLIAVFAISSSTAFSQLKIGNNPTQINKSSILELESDKQGFLLPRLADTAAINLLTPPDGMLIYLASSSAAGRGLYIRKSGIWQRFVTDSIALNKWSKDGDVLAGTEKLGALNAQKLSLITNNIERLAIDGTTGDVTISENATINKNATITQNASIGQNASVGKSLTVGDTATIGKLTKTGQLEVADSVKFKALNRDNNLTEVLVIDTATGSVRRRYVPTDAFKTWIVGAFSQTAVASGITRQVGTGVNGVDTLVLHAADATNAGGVSIVAQDFGGHKTFVDTMTAAKTVLVGATGAANSNLQVTGSVALSIKAVTADYTITNADYTILVNPSAALATLTLPAASSSINGRTYIIKKTGGGLDKEVKVVTAGGNIEDGTSFSIYNDWTVVKFQTDGTTWFVIK